MTVRKRDVDRARAFAARYRAEHEDHDMPAPTDANLRTAFVDCARPIGADQYPLVREALASWWLWRRPRETT